MARCECPCGCRADATGTYKVYWGQPYLGDRPSCAPCEVKVFSASGGDWPCGRRTENFSRCHVCHEPISWDSEDRKSKNKDAIVRRLVEARWGRDLEGGYLIYGACRCGSTAWNTWKRANEKSVSYAYSKV